MKLLPNAFRSRPDLVVAFDSEADPPVLPLAWKAGSLVDRTRHSIGVGSWGHLRDDLIDIQARGTTIRHLQLWSHGTIFGPQINGRTITETTIRDLASVLTDLESFWLRCCMSGRNLDLIAKLVDSLGATVAAHTEVISAPVPWKQRGLVACRPGRAPAWDPKDPTLPACSVLRMELPAWAYRDKRP